MNSSNILISLCICLLLLTIFYKYKYFSLRNNKYKHNFKLGYCIKCGENSLVQDKFCDPYLIIYRLRCIKHDYEFKIKLLESIKCDYESQIELLKGKINE